MEAVGDQRRGQLGFGTIDTIVRYFLPEAGRVLMFVLVMAVLFRKPHGFAPRVHA